MNNPLGLSKTNLNEIFADVKVLFQDNLSGGLSEWLSSS